ncbi:hypothetical protein SCLCIDRAFT_1207941 [Scleroderma citrinum Foug A]|uniref:Uncharacterized protein n=1 Tax=Scleroderma citrinum Foug A TaxID=1036808 RepID=A0A0C3A749_9AGAM|nr:hypothetical protein SCLCIDRAFT_1207941 [Scleroderma citrinum Foug A]
MNAPFTAVQCGPRIQRYHRECGPMDFASQNSFLDAFSTRRTVTVVKCIAWIRYWFVIGTRQNFGPASRRRALHLTWAKLHRWAIISHRNAIRSSGMGRPSLCNCRIVKFYFPGIRYSHTWVTGERSKPWYAEPDWRSLITAKLEECDVRLALKAGLRVRSTIYVYANVPGSEKDAATNRNELIGSLAVIKGLGIRLAYEALPEWLAKCCHWRCGFNAVKLASRSPFCSSDHRGLGHGVS